MKSTRPNLEAYREKWPKNQFVFVAQTHHVDVDTRWYEIAPDGQTISNFFRMLRPGTRSLKDALELLNRDHYVKEVFFDSDTVYMHMLGQMLQVPNGENRIIWGTDSIWGGSPQSQIVRLRRFRIKDELVEKYKYPATDSVKSKILGLNAARLFGVDVDAARRAIKKDKLVGLRNQYREELEPSNTQYGWVWRGRNVRRPAPPASW